MLTREDNPKSLDERGSQLVASSELRERVMMVVAANRAVGVHRPAGDQRYAFRSASDERLATRSATTALQVG